jgi:hypothetical protein
MTTPNDASKDRSDQTPKPALTALGSGIVLPDGTPAGGADEPSAEELARRPKRMQWDPKLGCWMWMDPLRREWCDRPNAHDMARAALEEWGAARPAKKANVSVQTLIKVAAGFDNVLAMSVFMVAHAGAGFAELGLEMGK